MRARQALLSGAEVVPGDTGRHFVKTGGSEKALRDFLSVQPDEVMVHGMPNLVSRKGCIWHAAIIWAKCAYFS